MTYRRLSDGSGDRAIGRAAGDEPAELIDLELRTLPTALRLPLHHRIGGSLAFGMAVLVIVAGIVFAARPDLAVTVGSPAPSTDPGTGAASDAPSAAPSRPSPRPGESPHPGNTPLPCVPMTPDDPVETALRFGSGTWFPVPGSDGSIEPSVPTDWSDAIEGLAGLDAERVMRVHELARVEITTSQRRCLGSWEITFVGLNGFDAFQTTSIRGNLDTPRASAEFVAPPAGDWVVRLVLRLPLVSGSRWIEAYARLIVGEMPATHEPQVQPLVPCGPESSLAEAFLLVDGSRTAGRTLGTEAILPPDLPTVAAPLGSATEIQIEGDRCAIAWRIELTRRPAPGDPPDGPAQTIEHATLLPNPTIAAQNRFPLDLGLAGGTWDVVGAFRFMDGTDIRRAWAIVAEPVVVPPLRVSAAGSPAQARAWNTPCLTVALRSGWSSGDGCGPSEPVQPLEKLVVPAGSRLSFEAIGWTMDGSWSAQYGMFAREDGASVGFRYVDSLRSASSPPVDFPVPPSAGTWTLELATCLRRDGNQVCGSWYVNVDVR